MISQLDEVIAPRAAATARGLSAKDGMSVGEFDAISGLSGIGSYLLCRQDNPAIAESLGEVIAALTGLCLDDKSPPRWHTPADLLGEEKVRSSYPFGNINLGLAHGIPGPLAFLSLAHLAGFSEPDLAAAIDHTASFLCEHRLDDCWGVNWPTAIPLAASGLNSDLQIEPAGTAPGGTSRCAWCYGSPGIARALWLAGQALDCDEYRNVAVSAMEAVFRRPIANRQIDSPTFCHGVAGLLAITLRFVHDSRGEVFVDEASDLVKQMLDRYQPDSLLGFRAIEIADHEVEQPGMLDGAPGVALALLAAATDVEPTWDRLFLLS